MVFRAGTIPWFCHDCFDIMVDFCFWVLEADGLHVAPFEHHTGGDGTLQAAGLNAAGWQAWMHEVIGVHGQRKCTWHYGSAQRAKDAWTSLQGETTLREERNKALLKSLRQTSFELLPAFLAKPFLPPDFWNGNPEVGQRLGELWEEYTHTPKQRDVCERKSLQEHLNGEWELVSPPGDPHPQYTRKPPEGEVQQVDLWRALEPYQTRLDGLIIYYIEYPQRIDYLVPPLSVVMTLVDGKLDYKDIIPRAVQAAETLATRTTSS